MIDAAKFRAARDARGFSQQQLAKTASVGQSTVDKIERGLTRNSRLLGRLAKALDVSAASLDPEYGADAPLPQDVIKPPPRLMNDVDTMPVYASAEGGNGQIIVTHDEIDRVERPYTLQGIADAYAILITGESMVPAYKPGDYAWVNPRLPPQRDTDCILYSVDEDSGEARATIKELLNWDARTWFLRQHNPHKDFPYERRIWTKHHRVVGNFRRR